MDTVQLARKEKERAVRRYITPHCASEELLFSLQKSHIIQEHW